MATILFRVDGFQFCQGSEHSNTLHYNNLRSLNLRNLQKCHGLPYLVVKKIKIVYSIHTRILHPRHVNLYWTATFKVNFYSQILQLTIV